MQYNLPPLNGLRAFEAAARHLSFKDAAKELFVTPGAISQQIKNLEDVLGVSLFHRTSRAIQLTESARILFSAASESFLRISDATAKLSSRNGEGPLIVSVLPSFAVKWLVPRLGRFRAKHQQFDVRISATAHFVDFAKEDVDIAIRHGLGEWKGLIADWLMQGDLFPVCSAELLENGPALLEPSDLKHYVLLHNETRDEWPLWLLTQGVEDVDADRGPSFSDDGMVIQAAIEGQGIALGRSTLVADDLHEGRLVKPFDLEIHSDLAYYLVYPPTAVQKPKIAAFRDWILAEASLSPE